MIVDEANGSQRVISSPFVCKRDMKCRAETISSPMLISTAANPTLKATIRSKPKPIRCIDTALGSTISAAGQGTMPPLMTRNDSFFTRVVLGKQNQTQGHDHHAGCDAQPWIKTLWDNILRSVEHDHAKQIDPG